MDDLAHDVETTPNGTLAFVLGDLGDDIAVIAYRAAGGRLWIHRFDGGMDEGAALAVSPDGTQVFVTGTSVGSSLDDYVTVAFRAATGAVLWSTRYNGPADLIDMAADVATSPDGAMVYVTGRSYGGARDYDYATVAYDAQTGTEAWVSTYDGSGASDLAYALALSPDGHIVYVTGESQASEEDFGDYATVAYDAAMGRHLWVSRYDGSVHDIPCCLQLSPTGSQVFVSGFTVESPSDYDWATVAYAAGDGAQEWVATHAGTGGSFDYAEAVAVSPPGDVVFVTGSSRHGTLPADADFTTIAYRAADGAESWLTPYDGRSGQEDRPCCIGISPEGGHVYVAGYSDRAMSADRYLAMIAYATGTGQQEWLTPHNDPSSTSEQPYALAVGPGGTRLFVTGTILFPATLDDLLTLALEA